MVFRRTELDKEQFFYFSVDDPDAIHRWVFRMVQQLLTPNSVDLTAR